LYEGQVEADDATQGGIAQLAKHGLLSERGLRHGFGVDA
tara:strand:- start:609 stop:725 length:117 start_codon:yes stop_codon:yes gene_type:complete